MRYHLMPYYYILARKNYDTGMPLMRRLDFYYPEYKEIEYYELSGKAILYFASEPVNGIGISEREVFIPNGTWIKTENSTFWI